MMNIMIVGAGQLGSRHLQGALQSQLKLNITVVDPSISALEIAESRANEVKLGNEFTQVQYMQKVVPGTVIDICIFATTSNVRFEAFQNLISLCRVKNIIFEKILFQKEEQYLAVEEVLNSQRIKAWVNCPRRIYPAYNRVQALLTNESSVDMTVTGSGWGLACNSVHFIDLFSFVTGNCKIQINNSLLEGVQSSKRRGFYEVFGQLSGSDGRGNVFNFSCSDSNNIEIEVEFSTPNYDITIKETGGELIICHGKQEVREVYAPLFQSQLTHINVEEIIKYNDSSLTDFMDSKSIHMPFIFSIKQHLEKSLSVQLDACPIT